MIEDTSELPEIPSEEEDYEQWAELNMPNVTGKFNDSLLNFERRCRLLLGVEQAKILPDNSLIAVLCDAVRLSREHQISEDLK